MKIASTIKQLTRMKMDKAYTGDEHNAINTACKALTSLESLESEYKAYHTGTDYWRGIRYALDVIEGVKE